jgi:hypothetical protein
MMLYAGHMTSAKQAAYELREAITAIVPLSSDEGCVEFLGGVSLDLNPATALELADWIRSNTQASRDNPNQLRLF